MEGDAAVWSRRDIPLTSTEFFYVGSISCQSNVMRCFRCVLNQCPPKPIFIGGGSVLQVTEIACGEDMKSGN